MKDFLGILFHWASKKAGWQGFAAFVGVVGICSLASASSLTLAPASWYLDIDDALATSIEDRMGIAIESGIYYADQRQVWYRVDISRETLMDPLPISNPALGQGQSFLGFAQKRFSEERELWLIKPSQEKFLLAILDPDTDTWNSRVFHAGAQHWVPVRGGILAFDADWQLAIQMHGPEHDIPKMAMDLRAFHRDFDGTELPVFHYDPVVNRLVISANLNTDAADAVPDVYAIDLATLEKKRLWEEMAWPFHLGNAGAFFVDGTELKFRAIELEFFNDESRLFGADIQSFYTLRADPDTGEEMDRYDFYRNHFFVIRPNASGRDYKYTIDSEGVLARFRAEPSRFTPSAADSDELMAGLENVEMLGSLKRGASSPLYGLKNINRFLSDTLGARTRSWAVLRYERGQMPEELVTSFVWEVMTKGVPINSEMSELDRAWFIDGERLFEVGDEALQLDYMRALHDVVRGRNAILFLKDFPTTLETQTGAVSNLLRMFYNVFRDCIDDGTCRVVMTMRENVYRNLYQQNFDIFDASRPYVVPRLDDDERQNVTEDYLLELERRKDLRVSEEAFEFITNFAMRFGRTQESPRNEVDLLDDLFTYIDTYLAGTREIDRNVAKSWVDHIRGIDVIRESLDIEGLRAYLKRKVVSHDEVIDEICDSLRPVVNGTHFSTKPLAFHTLVGTPGVGKTYIAKLIAEYLTGQDSLLMIDMRTFSGFDRQHPVWQALSASRNDIRVVLFDDVDQVGTQQLDLLAGIVEEGRYAQGTDGELSFSNTIVLWTSNWGESIIRDRAATNDSIRQQLRRHLTESQNGARPIMRRRIWSRIESTLWALRPFTEKQLFELALVHAKGHIEDLSAVSGVELKIDPRLLIRLIAYEDEAQAGARSIINQLEANVYRHYQDALSQPGVEKIVMLQVNTDVEVFTNLDEDFDMAWDEAEEITDDNIQDFVDRYGADLDG